MNPPDLPSTPAERRSWRLIAAAAACAAFGLALIANVHLPAEGSWHFLARSWLRGQRLYADLHLVQQPLYILLVAAFQAVFGTNWLADKVLGIVTLVAFVLVCARLTAHLRLPWPLDCCGFLMLFFLGIRFVAFRFDDYHAVMQCLVLASLDTGLDIERRGQGSREWRVLLLACMAALGIALRLNDGAVLAAANVAVLWTALPAARRWRSIATFSIATVAGILLIVAITGDTVQAWAASSIARGAAAKGGESLLTAPVMFFSRCFTGLFSLDSVGSFQFLLDLGGVAALVAGLAGMAGTVSRPLADAMRAGGMPPGMFLLPLGLCVSASMSGGGYHHDHFFATAVVALLAIAWAVARWSHDRVILAAAVGYGAVAVVSAAYRWNDPCSWHDYRSEPMFRDRMFQNEPPLGLLVISGAQQEFNEYLLGPIRAAGDVSLLSIPYPYPNYVLGIPPWHDHVQTFFDTTDRSSIATMIRELATDPPDWIVYQRQPDNLTGHEQLFNGGRPLPHRELDSFIEERLTSNAWQAVRGMETGRNSTWYVIRTRPPKP